MKYSELLQYARAYAPAHAMDNLLPVRSRRTVRHIFVAVAGILGLLVALDFFAGAYPRYFVQQMSVGKNIDLVRGLFFVMSSVSLMLSMLEAFYTSHVYKFVLNDLGKRKGQSFFPVTYDVSRILFTTPKDDVLAGFLRSPLAKFVCDRLGIFPPDIKTFLGTQKTPLGTDNFTVSVKGDVVTFADYARSIFSSCPEFNQFLFSYGVTEKMWNGVVEWISRIRYAESRENRFWSRENLARIPSLGKDWSYGKAWTLMRFANPVQSEPFYRAIDESIFAFYRKEFEEIETVLIRAQGANALIVSRDSENGMELVGMLGMAIERGYAYPQLEGKRVFFLRPSLLLNGVSSKVEFEGLVVKILQEAVNVGNIIVAIENFALLVETAHSYGTDIISLLGVFMNSSDIHIIGLVDEHVYHASIEPNRSLAVFFEKVVVPEKDEDVILRVVEDEVGTVEAREKIFVTYQALRLIVENSKRYFSDSFLYDKARDILTEIGPFVRRQGKLIVMKEDVMALFEEKTGIPLGQVTDAEKDKLINLETTLHRRVIGQEEAVKAISSALRRARAGVGNPNRPIGSFLFLGPTGVGKTETTKALAEVFFGDEASITRFDMSEYRTDDALSRLIGSFEGTKTGVLSTKLREKPYTVLLLDEFEKTQKEVLDLFLQILDEGFFSDMNGEKVNVRNAIIIATSNAGSDMIFNFAKENVDVQSKKEEIIGAIIERGIFKPELINRFDGTILFNPINKEDMKKIAGLMLVKLEYRLKEKGIKLGITEELITVVAEKGMDPAFGARPMNRYIQEKIEALVADKIIRGQVNEGDTLMISPAELQ